MAQTKTKTNEVKTSVVEESYALHGVIKVLEVDQVPKVWIRGSKYDPIVDKFEGLSKGQALQIPQKKNLSGALYGLLKKRGYTNFSVRSLEDKVILVKTS